MLQILKKTFCRVGTFFLNIRQILLWYSSMTFSNSMHVLWMEWKTWRAEKSRSELYPKNDCSLWQLFSVNLHLLVTLSYLQEDKPVTNVRADLRNMNAALLWKRLVLISYLLRTWRKLKWDVPAFMKYWFWPLNSFRSWNGDTDDGGSRGRLMQVLSLEPTLVLGESKSHFSHCRVHLGERICTVS